jgi:hypothetical protein
MRVPMVSIPPSPSFSLSLSLYLSHQSESFSAECQRVSEAVVGVSMCPSGTKQNKLYCSQNKTRYNESELYLSSSWLRGQTWRQLILSDMKARVRARTSDRERAHARANKKERVY